MTGASVKSFATLFLVVLLCAVGDTAFAGGGTLQPVQSTLQTLVQILTGPIATAIAVLAVIGCGFLAFVGRFSWFAMGSAIGGIVLVFGSASIVAFFQSAVGQ